MKRYFAVATLCIMLTLSICSCGNSYTQTKLPIEEFEYIDNIMYEKAIFPIVGAELDNPGKIAVYDDLMYICDTGNDRIVVCNLDGEFVKQIGSLGILSEELASPGSFAVNREYICVSDDGNRRIQILTKDGEYIREYPLGDWFSSQFTSIADIEIDEAGMLYISVVAYAKNVQDAGIYVVESGNLTKIRDLAVGKFGKGYDNSVLFATEYEYTKENQWISGYAELLVIEGGEVKLEKGISNPTCSAVSVAFHNSEIFIFNLSMMRIDVFDMNGKYAQTVYAEEVSPSNNWWPGGFCVDHNGGIYFSDSKSGNIYRLVPIGSD